MERKMIQRKKDKIHRRRGVMNLLMVLFLFAIPCFAQDAASIAAQAQASGQNVTTQQVESYLQSQGKATASDASQPDATKEGLDDIGVAPELPPLEAGLSSVELLLAGQVPTDVNTVLTQFGYNVFDQSGSMSTPLRNAPVGPDYHIGPGDGFTVTMWGRHSDQIEVIVGNDGKIALPEVGVLSVAGMTFEKLESYLDSELKRKFTDFKMHIAMGRIRTIQVYVVGEARILGTTTVSSLSTAINALFSAGGPTKNGSMRNIKIIQNGQPPVELDLYDFLMAGNRRNDTRLQDGDTISIPLIGPVVGIAGNVKRPAIYELKDELTLGQALDLAGGITYAGYLQRVQIERVENHKRRIVSDFDLSDSDSLSTLHSPLSTTVNDGDLIKVFPISGAEQNVVYLEGHVIQEGKYELKQGMRLGDILNNNSFQPQVNMEYGEIQRLVPPDFHSIIVPFNLGQLLGGVESENHKLARFDTIRLFRWDERAKQGVSVSGMIYEPNEYRFISGMRLSDLVDSAGGLMKNSYMKIAEITRRHITQEGLTTEKIEIELGKAIAGDPDHNILLQDYDHLVVRPIPELALDLMVSIKGEVRFPGDYPIRKGERLSSLIDRAGGFTHEAYLRGAVFTRESAMAVQQERMDDLVQQLERSLLSSTEKSISGAIDSESAQVEAATLEAKQALVQKLQDAEIDGRVVITLKSLADFKGTKYDLDLENGDELSVPKEPGIVHVLGEVFNPTSLLYEEDQTIEYYMSRVGGMTKEAEKKQVSVIRADGSVVSMAQKSSRKLTWNKERKWWSAGGNFMGVHLDPGDTIIVPRKFDRVPWLRTTKDLTQIVFQIALAAGVVIAL